MSARNNAPITQKQIDRFKQRAKAIKKQSGITHAEALDAVAREEGFGNWKAIINESEEEDNQEDFDFGEHDFIEEGLPPVITPSLEAANKAYLTKLGIEYAVFIPTDTGFTKYTIDATAPIRTLFELTKFHFYWNQAQGEENKIVKPATLLFPMKEGLTSQMSLYRPHSKNGDPRMWFSSLKLIAAPWDEVAIIIFNDAAFLINLSRYNLADCSQADAIGQFLNAYIQSSNLIANELLSKLLLLAQEPMPAIGKGDTTIGMTIEKALGILPNSSKAPDYKGIEIKSGRGNRNRTTLFGQVPIWMLSKCKSSREIFERYGYVRDDEKRLNCTVSTLKRNSQGLMFIYNKDSDQLVEVDADGNEFAIWTGDLLRTRLKQKHTETFWIEAKSETINGVEHFFLKSVTHTKSPILTQLMPLIENGIITMDHLSSGNLLTGTYSGEKGPFFKMNKQHLALLFPEPIKYILA